MSPRAPSGGDPGQGRVWGLLRTLLPAKFRERYADQILQHHVDRLGGPEEARGPGFWLPLAWDLILTGLQVRFLSGAALLDALGRNLRYGFRVLRRNPGFSATAVLTLALGIGANTAVFSLVYGTLMRPLPYPEADRLVWVAPSFSLEVDLGEWRTALTPFERLEAFGLASLEWRGDEGARRVRGMRVSDGLLPLLGAVPERGRLWSAREAEAGETPVAMVSHRFWRDELGGRDVTELSVRLGDDVRSVIGVLPSGFGSLGYDVDVWVPRAQGASGSPNLIGRLRPGATVASARAAADDLLARLEPAADPGLRTFINVNGFDEVFRGEIRTPLLVLFGAALLVLLLACVNVGNLLLSRAVSRVHEMALRTALGASRLALGGQILAETAVLAAAGGGLGLLLAWILIHHVPGALPPRYFSRLGTDGVGIDGVALAFAAVATTVTTLLAGLAPILGSARTRPSAGSRGRATSSQRSHRWRDAFVATQMALSFVLLVGTMLLVRSYLTLRPSDPGFETRDRVVAQLALPEPSPANVTFVRRLIREVELAVPGADAAVVNDVPLSGMISVTRVTAIDGTPTTGGDTRPPSVDFHAATPDYLDLMGMELLAGRGLAASDDAEAPFALVVNERTARRLWPDDPRPLGRRLTLDLYTGTPEFTVVGVLADTRSLGNTTRARREVFAAYEQVAWPRVTLVAHLPEGGQLDDGTIRRLVAGIDPTVPVDRVTTLEAVAAGSVSRWRYEAALMSGLGGLSLLLAVIGCYGVLAHTVAQRKREIGIRMALGAGAVSVVVAVLRRGALQVGAGLAAGALIALAVTRVLESSLVGVSPRDPASFLAAAALLGMTSMGAAWLPARRAARVEPATTLAGE